MEVNNGTRNARNGNETDEEKTRKQTPKKCQWKNDANGKADSDLMIRQWNQSPPYLNILPQVWSKRWTLGCVIPHPACLGPLGRVHAT